MVTQETKRHKIFAPRRRTDIHHPLSKSYRRDIAGVKAYNERHNFIYDQENPLAFKYHMNYS